MIVKLLGQPIEIKHAGLGSHAVASASAFAGYPNLGSRLKEEAKLQCKGSLKRLSGFTANEAARHQKIGMSIQEGLISKQEFIALLHSLPTKRLVEQHKKYALPTLGITLSNKRVSTMKPPELVGPIQRALAAMQNILVINTVIIMTKAE
jgi:hypothetical protein